MCENVIVSLIDLQHLNSTQSTNKLINGLKNIYRGHSLLTKERHQVLNDLIKYKDIAYSIPIEFARDPLVLDHVFNSTNPLLFFPKNTIKLQRNQMLTKMKETPKMFKYFADYYGDMQRDEGLGDDQEIIELASREPANFQFLPKGWQNKNEVLLRAVESKLDYSFDFRFVLFKSVNLENRELMMHVAKLAPKYFSTHLLDTEEKKKLFKDRELLRVAVLNGYGYDSDVFPEEWKDDKEIMLACAKDNMFDCLGESLMCDKEFIELLVRNNGLKVDLLRFENDIEFQERLLAIDPELIISLPHRLSEKSTFLNYVSKVDLYRHAQKRVVLQNNLPMDVDSIKESLKYYISALYFAPIEIWTDLAYLNQVLQKFKKVKIDDLPKLITSNWDIIELLIENGSIHNILEADLPRGEKYEDLLIKFAKISMDNNYTNFELPQDLLNDKNFLLKLLRKTVPNCVKDSRVVSGNIEQTAELARTNPHVYIFAPLLSFRNDIHKMVTIQTGHLFSSFDNEAEFERHVEERMINKYCGISLPSTFKFYQITAKEEMPREQCVVM